MGRKPNVPNTMTVPYEELCACVGDKYAMKLCKYFGGLRIPSALAVLRARRDAALIKDWFNGAQTGELSAKYGMHKKSIRTLIKKTVQERITAGVSNE